VHRLPSSDRSQRSWWHGPTGATTEAVTTMYNPDERITREQVMTLTRRSEATVRRQERKHGIAGEIDPNLYDKIAGGAEPIRQRPGELVPPVLDRIRKERGPFASDDDLLLAAFYDKTQYQALKAAGPIDTEYPIMETPLLTLVKELSARPTIRSFQFTRPIDNGTTAGKQR